MEISYKMACLTVSLYWSLIVLELKSLIGRQVSSNLGCYKQQQQTSAVLCYIVWGGILVVVQKLLNKIM